MNFFSTKLKKNRFSLFLKVFVDFVQDATVQQNSKYLLILYSLNRIFRPRLRDK